MLNPIVQDVLRHEGVVTIISEASNGYHVVNTWNSYMRAVDDTLYAPAAGMHSLEADIEENPHVLLTLGTREVEGLKGPGTGFHIQGNASFLTTGPLFEQMKAEYPFLSRVLKIDVTQVDQKI
ncbi:FMN-binding protein [Enterococcus canis]|uniref:FMN-binding protein n=1 Tax=Enterococcus canis TaxID=214095 RepID=A0A1L8REH7_9ENTE|nr:pyridoxamine 5'-phosphate oxidase family protein [Enterococcus canis]OJG18179.1 FMN-binding protein [Enterococcus canis]